MTQPTTWEEAVADVALGLPSWRDCENLSLDDVLQDIEEVLDSLRKEVDWHSPWDQFRLLAWYGAVGYVLEKWGDPQSAWMDGAFAKACYNVVRDVLVLLPKKQHDYGPDNILWGGVQGVVIRAHDKLARIKNLRSRQRSAALSDRPITANACNEPLSDSYFDLIGYGIVGAMLVKGTFQLPLEADLPDMRDDGLAEPIDDVDHPLFFDEEVEIIRGIVRDELAKREIAKLHG